MEKLTDDDLEMLQKVLQHVEMAAKNLEAARGAKMFVESTIAHKYQIGPRDVVDADGTINRGTVTEGETSGNTTINVSEAAN